MESHPTSTFVGRLRNDTHPHAFAAIVMTDDELEFRS